MQEQQLTQYYIMLMIHLVCFHSIRRISSRKIRSAHSPWLLALENQVCVVPQPCGEYSLDTFSFGSFRRLYPRVELVMCLTILDPVHVYLVYLYVLLTSLSRSENISLVRCIASFSCCAAPSRLNNYCVSSCYSYLGNQNISCRGGRT